MKLKLFVLIIEIACKQPRKCAISFRGSAGRMMKVIKAALDFRELAGKHFPVKTALIKICLVTLAAAAFVSCRKSSSDTLNHGKIAVNIRHKVDGIKLIFDSVAFINEAGNRYSVERLQYYLSDFRLYRQNKLYYSGNEIVYVDARTDSLCSFNILPAGGLFAGVYDSISFYIGVDPGSNVANGLPAAMQNINMEWPAAMGGGYHFLKLEGHWLDGSERAGYAMHIGQTNFLVAAGARCQLMIKLSGDAALSLSMNVNEWFRRPGTYSFITDGVFSMGDSALMKKLSDNGRDVFNSD
jgi:hypothetical protein